MVRPVGLEPTGEVILSHLRLPFRHGRSCINCFVKTDLTGRVEYMQSRFSLA